MSAKLPPPKLQKERNLKILTNPLAVVITVARDHKKKLRKRNRLAAHTQVVILTRLALVLNVVKASAIQRKLIGNSRQAKDDVD
jgi:hypothetical protein